MLQLLLLQAPDDHIFQCMLRKHTLEGGESGRLQQDRAPTELTPHQRVLLTAFGPSIEGPASPDEPVAMSVSLGAGARRCTAAAASAMRSRPRPLPETLLPLPLPPPLPLPLLEAFPPLPPPLPPLRPPLPGLTAPPLAVGPKAASVR